MATSGARVLLRLRRTGGVPRLRPAEANRQHGRRCEAGVTTIARQSSSSSSHPGHFLRSAPAAAPWRRARATGPCVLLPRQTARALTSGVVRPVVRCCLGLSSRLACFLLRGLLRLRRTLLMPTVRLGSHCLFTADEVRPTVAAHMCQQPGWVHSV